MVERMKFQEVSLPSSWASALINDDWTGYKDDEIRIIKELLRFSGLQSYFCVDVADDSTFQQVPSYWGPSYELLAGNYSTFTFQLR